MARELVLYDAKVSGNAYKVRLALAQLGLPYRRVPVDIALFGYVHVAPEGGFTLDPCPAILAWLDRVRAQPGFVSMDE